MTGGIEKGLKGHINDIWNFRGKTPIFAVHL